MSKIAPILDGNDFQKPDMGNRGSQLNVAQPFPADLGLDNLDTAFLADDAAVLHALVLAAIALVVFNRTENLGTEQTVAFRLKCPVVDGLRFFYLTM